MKVFSLEVDMKHLRSVAIASAAAAILGCALTGCVVAPARPYYVGEAPVAFAPPPPQVEYVGPPPVVGQIWIGGFWDWRAGRHVWIGGHWEAPRPGYRWVPHAWAHEGDGWHLHRGHWDRH